MKQVVELTADGAIQLPANVLEQIKPLSRFELETQDGTLILRPAEREPYFWETATPEEWVANFRQWVASHKDGPNLPAEAFRRENMYD